MIAAAKYYWNIYSWQICTIQADWPAFMVAQYFFSVSKSVFWSTETEKGGSIMWCGQAPAVCLSNLYMWSVRRRKFCWMPHCDWPLQLTSRVGRNMIRYGRGNAQPQLCFSAWTPQIRDIHSEIWTLPFIKAYYVHSPAKIFAVGNNCAVRKYDFWPNFDVEIPTHCHRKTLKTTDGGVKLYKMISCSMSECSQLICRRRWCQISQPFSGVT